MLSLKGLRIHFKLLRHIHLLSKVMAPNATYIFAVPRGSIHIFSGNLSYVRFYGIGFLLYVEEYLDLCNSHFLSMFSLLYAETSFYEVDDDSLASSAQNQRDEELQVCGYLNIFNMMKC